MKKCVLTFVILTITVSAQYQIKSPYLLNPELAIGYVDSCAKFWLKAYDTQLGGFYTNIDKYGNLLASSGTQKNLQTQSRDAYGLVRAFMLTGNETFLQRARQGLDFMYAHAWDNTNGGWYWELDKYGNPTSGNSNKDAFHQHYALLGPAALYEAAQDSLAWYWLMRGYANNESKMWDSRPSYFGYYDYCSANWSAKNGKSFNATVDAITTHLLTLWLLTGEQQYKNKMLQMADNILNRLVASMNSQQIGFAEKYDANWGINLNEKNTLMGHVLKTAWCLGRVFQFFGDSTYIAPMKKLIDHVYQKGYDKQFGGPYKDYDRTTGQMLMWGNPDTAKAWWQMEQAVTGGLMVYDITQEKVYLKIADETLDFFMKYFVDHVYGDVYENRTRYGLQTWGENKGNGNKAGYHSIELGYYTYLYGSMFVTKTPFTCYYQFAPKPGQRSISLNPLEIATERYRIKDVTLDGVPYSGFVAAARTLNIPAGAGGKFRVTFEPVSATGIAETGNTIPAGCELLQNYPNPFNPSTSIRYSLAKESKIRLSVFDLLGREIRVLADEMKTSGVHSVGFDGGELPSGIYYYTLQTANTQITKKMILLR